MRRTGWDPFAELQRMSEFMNRMYPEGAPRAADGAEPAQHAWTPEVDIWETESDFHFAISVSGVSSERIDVNLEGETLTIRGVREAEERRYHRQEIPNGPFFRSFTLGVPVDNARVEAAYRNGILEVKVPKAEAAKPRKVQVKVE